MSPKIAFLARPTWNGPLGLALVCSISTDLLLLSTSPKSTLFASQKGSAAKFRYPPLDDTSNSPLIDELSISAISLGDFPNCLANAKHGRDKSPCDFSLLGPSIFSQELPSIPKSNNAF